MSLEIVKNKKEIKKLLPGQKIIAIMRGGECDGAFVVLTPTLEQTGRDNLDLGFMKITNSHFEPWPETDESQRDVILITSPSGCGKSYYAAMYGENFLEQFPKSRIIIITPEDTEKDPAYRDLKHVWIPTDELEDENGELLTLDDIRDEDDEPTLIIFDDVENLFSKKQDEILLRFASMCLQRGRKAKIYIAFILHRAACGLLSRFVLQEQTACVFSSVNHGSSNLAYALEKHMGFDKSMQKTIKDHAAKFGRMVYVKTSTAHRYVLSDRIIALL